MNVHAIPRVTTVDPRAHLDPRASKLSRRWARAPSRGQAAAAALAPADAGGLDRGLDPEAAEGGGAVAESSPARVLRAPTHWRVYWQDALWRCVLSPDGDGPESRGTAGRTAVEEAKPAAEALERLGEWLHRAPPQAMTSRRMRKQAQVRDHG
jgi:hypothetical protein